MIRDQIEPAATQIVEYLKVTLAAIGPPVDARPVAHVEREVNSHINIRVIDDTAFDEWTSFDAEGRSLEVDIEVRVKDRDTSYTEAKAIAARIEQILLTNNGSHLIGGGRVRAERVVEPTDSDREGEKSYTMLPIQYSFLHRLVKGSPQTIK